MKYTITIAFLVLFGRQAMSQLPEDALRMSWNTPSGTARNQAIGGAMGSLGGEITSTFVNPAGLGFFKVSEIVLSPGFTMARSKGSFRETDATGNNLSRFNFSTSGFVSATTDPGNRWVSKAFSIAVNRTANFNNRIYYRGQNDYSSYSEQFAEEFSRSGVSINDVRYSPYLSLGTKMAIYTYLIDTATLNGQLQVVGRPEYLNAVNQENKITTRGGISEIALGYAGNLEDRFYIGGSIGVPIVKYERTTVFTETDASGDPNNNFKFSRYEERLSTSGVGLNGKLGIIFKPARQMRFGIAIHTPTIYGLREKLSGKMVTDVERLFGPNDPGVDSINSDYYYGNSTPVYKYDMSSPWKFLVSGSYVLHEVEDVSAQKGFITADLEYVTYGSSRFSAAEQGDDESYFESINKVVKDSYKGAFNFRIGGELKFNTIMARLGFAHYGNPYKDDALKARRINVSGGLGYRDKGIFIDLTYVHSIIRDVNFPYRLADKDNTFADIKSRVGQILLTLGFKI
ncbi:aromatic hydrocarbon degradation protein [Niastella caeni]|uniref:Aromatic hydrocarbon degradation protein n=1 Tax=Niastella caeni TaxID=2569763 RepID=A0A4S8HRL5_9BACT|nr:aromatic hydrocarbon degradation protein [Niastella caeni]THU38083.1 aromatic hydrocarbon degradation protein [Niastella caeni]